MKKDVLNMKTEYNNIPVIMGGDLNFWNLWENYGANAESETKPYKALVGGGMTLASRITGVNTNFQKKDGETNYTNSYHGYYEYDAKKKIYDTSKTTIVDPYTLDYIFIYNHNHDDKTATTTDYGITAQRYYILKDDLTDRASDHSPTLIDFVFN